MDCPVTNPDIERAIRRSRAARSAIVRRKRRLAIAAIASVALSGGIGLSLAGFTPVDAVEAAASKAKSLAELIDQRSPGERTAAMLTKIKKSQRALPKVRKPVAPPASAVPSELANILAPPAGQMPVELASPVALLDVGPPTLASILTPPPGGSIISPPGGSIVTPPGGSSPPGGGGGGGVIVTPPGDGTPTQPPEGPHPPPVPEPGTWATMLLGFAFIGWRIRRTSKNTPQPLRAG